MIQRAPTPDENGRVWEIAKIDGVRAKTTRDIEIEQEERGFEVFWQQDDFGQPIAGIPAVPGIRITPESALLCSVVCACVRVIAETCSQLPLHLIRNLEGGGKAKETANPLYRLLHTAPNKRHSSFAFRELMTSWCALYGNAYAEIVRVRGQITALVPLHPSRMSLERLENRELRFRYNEPTGGVTYYTEEQILHLSWMSSDGLVGMMPVGLARDAIQMARACEIHGIGFFANSARPSVVLETDHSIPPEAQERLREAWERVHRGPAQAGKTAILPNGLKAHELGQSNSDQQYLELRQFQIAEIARIWRVPPHLVGDLSRATFSNIESQGLDFLNYCIMPWIRRWESAFQMALFPDEPELGAEFDVRGLMRADSATRASYYQTCMNLGIYSLNEVRELETLPPVEGGDVRFVTLNVQTLEAALAAAKNPQPAGPEPAPAPSGDSKADAATNAKRSLDARNCGTGAGGFQAGNKCAAGGSGEEAGEAHDDDENAERTAKLIDVMTRPENSDGFTVDPAGFDTPADGLMVSLHDEQNTFSASEIISGKADAKILQWIEKVRPELDSGDNKFIGGWLDSGDGKFYLDVATRFEPTQMAEVLEAARDHGQYAVFNLDTKNDTWVRYENNDPRKPADYDAQFAKWLASRGLTDNDYKYGRDSVRSIDDFLDEICKRARLFDALRRAGVAEKDIPALAGRALRRLADHGKLSAVQHPRAGEQRADSRRDQATREEHRAEAVAEAPVGENCGTGAGGFKPGNTCAKGGGEDSQAASESGGTPQSAENCPAPCEMLAPVEDGGVFKLPGKGADVQMSKNINWNAARNADDDVQSAIRAYTGSAYDAANEAARGDNLDHVIIDDDSGAGALDDADPSEIVSNYLDSDYTEISDDNALSEIEEKGPMIADWEQAETDAQALYEDIKANLPASSIDTHAPEQFDPAVLYANAPGKDSPMLGENGEPLVVLEGAKDEDIAQLNSYASQLLDYQTETEKDSASDLRAHIDSLVFDNSSESSYDPDKNYIDSETAFEKAYAAAAESGDYADPGTTLSRLDEGLHEIAADANDGKPILTFRGTGAGTYEAVAKDLSPGDTFTSQGFLSTSASRTFAVNWKGSGSLKTLWRIVGKSGAPVDRISSNEGEKEVLYPHSANFRVARVANNVTVDRSVATGGTPITGVQVIDLVEID
jgi:HK97 family phage portal protein